MTYRASNGITTVDLTNEEAREHYRSAEVVRGGFGGRFITAIVGENGYGRRIVIAETTYTPVKETPRRPRRRRPPR